MVSAVVGVFTVMRGQSFAGHSLADVATAGGSGAFLAGISPLFGFVAGGVAGAGAMEMIGVRRARGRDLATGIVLGASIGAGRPVPVPRHHAVLDDRRQPADPVRFDLQHPELDVAGRRSLERVVPRDHGPRPQAPAVELGQHRHSGRSRRARPRGRDALHARPGPRRGPFVPGHRRNPLHRAAHRPSRHSLAPHEADRLGDGNGMS